MEWIQLAWPCFPAARWEIFWEPAKQHRCCFLRQTWHLPATFLSPCCFQTWLLKRQVVQRQHRFRFYWWRRPHSRSPNPEHTYMWTRHTCIPMQSSTGTYFVHLLTSSLPSPISTSSSSMFWEAGTKKVGYSIPYSALYWLMVAPLKFNSLIWKGTHLSAPYDAFIRGAFNLYTTFYWFRGS